MESIAGKRGRPYEDSGHRSSKKRKSSDDSPYYNEQRHHSPEHDHRKSRGRIDENDKKSKKKEKKDKKERKKRKKEEKKLKKQLRKEEKKKLKDLEQQAKKFLEDQPTSNPPSRPPSGFSPSEQLSSDNYYSHNREFRHWLIETRNLRWDDLSNAEARKLFTTFVELWNSGSLEMEYYNQETQITNEYNWKIKTDSQPPPAKKTPHSRRSGGESNDRGTEEKDQYEMENNRERLRAERKRYNKYNQYVEEELVPKATGREALLEKKKLQRSIKNSDRDTEVEYSDDFLMGGGGEDIKAAFKRSQDRHQTRHEKVEDDIAKRRAEYSAKENATMQFFHDLVQKGNFPLLKPE